MPPDNRPPRLGSDTLRSRARASGQIAEAKSQTRQRVAEDFETQDVEDVPVALDEGRLQPTSGFLEMARPMEAAAEFDPQFPRQDVGPDDVRETDQGFAPAEDVQRRKAAFEFEEETPLDDVDPQRGVAKQGGGFGLATPARRRLGAIRLDDQFPQQDLSADDVEVTDDGVRPEEDVQRRRVARNFEQQTPLSNIDPFKELKQTGDGFELAGPAESRLETIQQRRKRKARRKAKREARQSAAAQIDEQLPSVEVGPDDIRRADGSFIPRDRVLKQTAAARAGDFKTARVPFDYLEDRLYDPAGSPLSLNDLSELGDDVTDGTVSAKEVADVAYDPGDNDQFTLGTLNRVLEASDRRTVETDPSDFRVAVGEDGDRSVSLTDQAQQERAVTQLDAQFGSVDLGVEDVEQVDAGGFGLDTGAQKAIAAAEFDPQLPDVDVGPDDITRDGESFAPTQNTIRQQAARDIDPQIPSFDVGVGDITRRGDAFGLTQQAKREASAEQIESETPLTEVDPSDDLKRDDGQFELTTGAAERLFDLNPDFRF